MAVRPASGAIWPWLTGAAALGLLVLWIFVVVPLPANSTAGTAPAPESMADTVTTEIAEYEPLPTDTLVSTELTELPTPGVRATRDSAGAAKKDSVRRPALFITPITPREVTSELPDSV